MRSSAPIVSRIGNSVVECSVELLRQMQEERLAHDISVAVESSEAEHDGLLARADSIRQRTSSAIAKAEAEHV